MNNPDIKESHKTESQAPRTIDTVNRGLARRYGKEQRFKFYGLLAVIVSLSFLGLLFFTIFLVFVFVMLLIDLGVFSRNYKRVGFREATVWSVIWVMVTPSQR